MLATRVGARRCRQRRTLEKEALLGQINVNPGEGTRDSGTNSLIAVLLVLVLVAFLVWAFAFGGMHMFYGGQTGAPAASNAPAGQSNTTINIEPKVNVQAPAAAPVQAPAPAAAPAQAAPVTAPVSGSGTTPAKP
jgi:hypothetical protein